MQYPVYRNDLMKLHNFDGAINDTIAIVILRWLCRGIIWSLVIVWVPVLASVLCATDNAIGVMWCLFQWHHIAKNVMLLFDCHSLRNAVMPLITPLASCDASDCPSGITWPKNPCCTSFQSFWHELNSAIDDAIASCMSDTSVNGITN